MNRLLLAFVIGILLVGIPAQSSAVSGNVSGNNTNVSGSIDDTPPVNFKGMKNPTKKEPKGPPIRNETIDVKQFKAKYGKRWSVEWQGDKAKEIYGRYNLGKGEITTERKAEEVAREFLSDNSQLFKIDLLELVVKKKELDRRGVWTVDYEQYYNGVHVYRGEVRVLLNNRSELTDVLNNFYPGIDISTTPVITKEEAVEIVLGQKGVDITVDDTKKAVNATLLYIVPKTEDGDIIYHLTWRVPTHTTIYFVSAKDGSIVLSVQTVSSASVYGDSKGWIIPDRGSNNLSRKNPVYEPFINHLVDILDATPPPVPISTVLTNSSGGYDSGTIPSGYYYVTGYLNGEHVRVKNDYFWGVPSQNYALGYITSDVQQNIDWGTSYRGSVYYHADYAWKILYDNFGHDQPKVHAYIPSFLVTDEGTVARAGYDDFWNEYFIGWNEDHLDYADWSDYVYHEYAHTVQYNLYNLDSPGDNDDKGGNNAVMEGWPEYFAGMINNDSIVGGYGGDLSNDIQIGDNPPGAFAGALWDIRKAIGASDADELIWYATKDFKPDNTSDFFAKLIKEDDKLWGNDYLDDGTPHSNDIWQAFYDQGMDYDAVVTLSDKMPLGAKLKSPDDDDVFRFDTPGSKFAAVGIRPSYGNDFDLSVYSDPGFTSEKDYSDRDNSKVDFVVLGDGEAAGDYYAKAYRYQDSEGFYVVEMENSVTTIGGGTIPGSFAYSEVFDVYQISLNVGTEYEFRVTPTSFLSGLDADIYLYSGTGGRYDEVNKSDAYGADDAETFTYTPSATGYYAVVITDENDAYGDYTLEITTPGCVDTTPPPTPTLSDPGSTIKVSDYRVDWSDVVDGGPVDCRGLSHYELQEDDSSTFPSPTTPPYTPGDSYRDFYSKPNGHYYYRVRAVDNAGNPSTSWSGWQDIVVDVPPPPPPPSSTPDWSLIDDFVSEIGVQGSDEGSWGDWVYYEAYNDDDNKVEQLSSFGVLSDVGKFHWVYGGSGDASQWIEKTGNWDFSYPADGKFTVKVYDGTEDPQDIYLYFWDSAGRYVFLDGQSVNNLNTWELLEFQKDSWSQNTGIDWSDVTKVWILVETGSGNNINRNVYFDDFGWEMDVYLRTTADKYVVDPGKSFTLRLKAVNKYSDTDQMRFIVDGVSVDVVTTPAYGKTYERLVAKSHSIPGTYTHTGQVDYYRSGPEDSSILSNPVEIIVIDNIPPVVGITTPQDGDNLNIQSIYVEWGGSDIPGIDYYEVKIDDAPSWTSKGLTTSHTFTGVTEGLHTVYVRAVDKADNSATDSVGFRVDLTAPSAPVPHATPSMWTSTNSFSIGWTGPSDASEIVGAYYKLDSLPTSDTDGTLTPNKPITGISVSGDGSHPIYVWLKDGAGNVDYTNYGSATLNYDGTAPSAPTDIIWQDGQYSADTSITADWGDAADTSGVVDYYLRVDVDSQDFVTGLIFNGYVGSSISSKTLTSADGVADGHTYYYQVKAKNGAGLISNTWSTKSAGVTVDTTPPDTTITSSPPDPSSSTSATFVFTSTEPGTFECELDSGGYTVCTSPKTYTGLVDGTHIFNVRAIDLAGNPDPMPATDTWTVDTDTALPQITITSPINTTIVDTTPGLNVTVDKQANITYSWNNGNNISGCRGCDSYNATYGELASETGISLLFHMNEDFGNMVYDDSSYSNDGLLVNGAGWATGRFGYGIELDGVDDGVDVAYDSSLDILDEDDGSKPFAFGVWFKLGVGALTSNNAILSQQGGAGTGRTWIQVRGNDDRLVSWLGYDGVTNHGVVSNTIFTEDRWYFVVITFNGTDIDLYVNGTFDTGVADMSVDENADGKYLFGRTKNLGNYFEGTIDEAMFFNRSLSATEILELYSRTLPDGRHNVTVYANDAMGNLDSATRWFTVSTLPGIAISSPLNDTIADTTPGLNVTVGKQANITYSWNNGNNISGCMSCDSYSTVYGEYADISEQSLVLAMHFNENFGDKVFDDSIYLRSGTLQEVAAGAGLPGWASGKFGGGLYFDNSGNDMLVNISDVDDGLEFGYGEDFTIMAWVKTGSNKSFGSWQYLINKVKSDNGWHFYIDYSGGRGVPGAMIHRSDGVDHSISGVTPVNDSKWHHLAWVVNWSYSVLYVDGERDATTSISGFPGAYSPDYTPYRIGQRLNSATLDELLVFNRSLSDLEISKIYNKNLPDGQHNVTVYATDVEGNKDSAARYFTVG